ncbi:hypothetical protein MMC25_007980 [Agyrium rufum]|nr:hypothetical protein [Agyrium rufum]
MSTLVPTTKSAYLTRRIRATTTSPSRQTKRASRAERYRGDNALASQSTAPQEAPHRELAHVWHGGGDDRGCVRQAATEISLVQDVQVIGGLLELSGTGEGFNAYDSAWRPMPTKSKSRAEAHLPSTPNLTTKTPFLLSQHQQSKTREQEPKNYFQEDPWCTEGSCPTHGSSSADYSPAMISRPQSTSHLCHPGDQLCCDPRDICRNPKHEHPSKKRCLEQHHPSHNVDPVPQISQVPHDSLSAASFDMDACNEFCRDFNFDCFDCLPLSPCHLDDCGFDCELPIEQPCIQTCPFDGPDSPSFIDQCLSYAGQCSLTALDPDHDIPCIAPGVQGCHGQDIAIPCNDVNCDLADKCTEPDHCLSHPHHSHANHTKHSHGPRTCLWISIPDLPPCNLVFPTSDALQIHLCEAHVKTLDSRIPLICRWQNCSSAKTGRPKDTKAKLIRHMVTHSGFRGASCPICGKLLSNEYTLQNHLRTHEPENEKQSFTCAECGAGFAHDTSLQTHILAQHRGEKKYVCNIPGCSYATADSSNFSKHKKTHEREKNLARCTVCGAIVTKKNFTRHVKDLHGGVGDSAAFAVEIAEESVSALRKSGSDKLGRGGRRSRATMRT